MIDLISKIGTMDVVPAAILGLTVIVWGWYKYVEAKDKHNREIFKEISDDIRKDYDAIYKKVNDVQDELDEWKGKYYGLVDSHNALKIEYEILKREYDDLKVKIDQLGCQASGI